MFFLPMPRTVSGSDFSIYSSLKIEKPQDTKGCKAAYQVDSTAQNFDKVVKYN